MRLLRGPIEAGNTPYFDPRKRTFSKSRVFVFSKFRPPKFGLGPRPQNSIPITQLPNLHTKIQTHQIASQEVVY